MIGVRISNISYLPSDDSHSNSHVSEAEPLSNDIEDSMKNNCFGIAQDLKIRCIDWGFRLPEVKTYVVMHHSRMDRSVPFVTAEMTARLLPNCRLISRESGEHISVASLDKFIREEMLG